MSSVQREQRPSVLCSQTQNKLSLFAGEPPADAEYIQQWVATLAAAFPDAKSEFWVIVAKIVRKDQLSRNRLSYIAEKLCREWRYPTLQIADILAIDRQVEIIPYREFYKRFGTTAVQGYCILEEKDESGSIQYCVTADAERAGLRIYKKY